MQIEPTAKTTIGRKKNQVSGLIESYFHLDRVVWPSLLSPRKGTMKNKLRKPLTCSRNAALQENANSVARHLGRVPMRSWLLGSFVSHAFILALKATCRWAAAQESESALSFTNSPIFSLLSNTSECACQTIDFRSPEFFQLEVTVWEPHPVSHPLPLSEVSTNGLNLRPQACLSSTCILGWV